MTTFTEEEKKFIKRAIATTEPDLEGMNLNPTNKEDLTTIMRTFRARGYIVGRRFDHGKEYDMWHSIMGKLGHPLKSPEQKLKENREKHANSLIDQLNGIYSDKIGRLEKRLIETKEERQKEISAIEQEIEEEIKEINRKKQDALERLEIAQTASQRVEAYNKKKAEEKRKRESEEKGLDKCMICGEWYKAGAGMTSHMRTKHPDEYEDYKKK